MAAAAPFVRVFPTRTEVVVLGTAQDAGVPQLGCTEERCLRALADPKARRRVASLGVRAREPSAQRVGGGAPLRQASSEASAGQAPTQQKDSLVLVDATPDIVTQVSDLQGGAARGNRPVDAVLLTHAHIGHYLGLAQLGREAVGARAVPVYGTRRMVDYLTTNGPWSLLVSADHIRPVPIEVGKPFELAPGLRAEAFLVPHRDEFTDTVGFFLSGPRRTLLYLPDIDRWAPPAPPLEDLVRRADVLLLDGTFWDPGAELKARDPRLVPHPPVPETMQKLTAFARSKTIRFIHLNHTNPLWDDGPERKELERAGMGIAEEGNRFEI